EREPEGRALARGGERLVEGRRGDDVELPVLEEEREGVARVLVVLDDEDARAREARGRARRLDGGEDARRDDGAEDERRAVAQRRLLEAAAEHLREARGRELGGLRLGGG